MTIAGLCFQAILVALVAAAAAQQAPIVSPEVHADRTVTFRYKDPGATKVNVGIEGFDSAPMARDASGVWTYTSPPLPPDIYGYSFTADGEPRIDTRFPESFIPNRIWSSSRVLVPGDPPEPWEMTNVPHGTVHHHFYHSNVIGDDRDYFVYTPPGYRPNGRTRYPVLYLLHGFSDMASAWTEVGKANLILDNLIAAGKCKPMLIVMTLGYGVPDYASPRRERSDAETTRKNYDLYRTALLTEVIPQIADEYKVKNDRLDRAIAGLSMGGAETLYVGLNNMDKFSYVGAFSSGSLRDGLDASFPGFDGATANKQLKLLRVCCGVEDGLIKFNRSLVAWLKEKQANVDVVESPGRHEWPVWRRNLISFVESMF